MGSLKLSGYRVSSISIFPSKSAAARDIPGVLKRVQMQANAVAYEVFADGGFPFVATMFGAEVSVRHSFNSGI